MGLTGWNDCSGPNEFLILDNRLDDPDRMVCAWGYIGSYGFPLEINGKKISRKSNNKQVEQNSPKKKNAITQNEQKGNEM